MKPIRVFYDDMYLYREFSQPVEGQETPLVMKLAVGTKPEYAELAAHIEEVYTKAFQTEPSEAAESAGAPEPAGAAESGVPQKSGPAKRDPAAVLAEMFTPGPKRGLPAEHYAEHTLFVSRLGTVWHLEYHSYPEPVLFLLAEPLKAGRREKPVSTRAILYDQSYTLGGQEYIVTSLRGNYADFPGYSPFFLDREQDGLVTVGREELLRTGASFEKADRAEGTRLAAESWLREQLIPRLLIGIFAGKAAR